MPPSLMGNWGLIGAVIKYGYTVELHYGECSI